MSLFAIAFGVATGAGIAASAAKLTRKKQDIYNPMKGQNDQRASSVTLFKNDLLNIMVAFIRENGKTFENFSLIEREYDRSKFQYFCNDYLFTVSVKNEIITCDIEEDGVSLVSCSYDVDWDEYDKKKISRSVIEQDEREKAMNLIDKFLFELHYFDWEGGTEGWDVVDDLNTIKNIESFPVTEVNEVNLSETEMLDEIKKSLMEIDVDESIKNEVTKIIQNIEKGTHEIKELELDVHSKHFYEELIEKDLVRLFNTYIGLTVDNREQYKGDALQGLKKIEQKTAELLQKIETRNVHDLQSVLHVITERYK
jgi:hypothetical protein